MGYVLSVMCVMRFALYVLATAACRTIHELNSHTRVLENCEIKYMIGRQVLTHTLPLAPLTVCLCDSVAGSAATRRTDKHVGHESYNLVRELSGGLADYLTSRVSRSLLPQQVPSA